MHCLQNSLKFKTMTTLSHLKLIVRFSSPLAPQKMVHPNVFFFILKKYNKIVNIKLGGKKNSGKKFGLDIHKIQNILMAAWTSGLLYDSTNVCYYEDTNVFIH